MADVNARANLDVNVTGESEIDKLNKKLNQKRKPVTINVTEKIKTVRSGATAKQASQAASAMRRAQAFQAKQAAAAAKAATAANRANATAALTQAANSIRAAARALYRAAVSLRTGIQGSVAGQTRVGTTNMALQAQIATLTRAVQAANRQNLTRASARGAGGAAAAVSNTGSARSRRFRNRINQGMRGNSEQFEDPIEIAFSIIRLATVAGAKISDILASGLGRALTPIVSAMQRIGPRFNRLGQGLKRFGGTLRLTANAIGATVAGLAAITAVLGVTTVYLGATAGINAIKKMLAGINEIAIQASTVAQNARLYGNTTGAQNKIENTLRGLPGLVDDATVQKFLKDYQEKMRKSIDDADEFKKNFGAKDGDVTPKQLFGFDHKDFKALNAKGGTGVIQFLQLMEEKLRALKKEDTNKFSTAMDTITTFSKEMADVLNRALDREPGSMIKRAEEEGSNRKPIDPSLAAKYQQDYQFAVSAVNDLRAAISERLFKPIGDKLVSFQKMLQGPQGKAFEDASVEKIKLVADSINDFLTSLKPETIGNAVKTLGDITNKIVQFGEKTAEVIGKINDVLRSFGFKSDKEKRDEEIASIEQQLATARRNRAAGESAPRLFGPNQYEKDARNKVIDDLNDKLLSLGGGGTPKGFQSRADKNNEKQADPADAAAMGQALIDKLKGAGESIGGLFGTNTIQSITTGGVAVGTSIGGAATTAMSAEAGAIGAAIGAAIASAIRGAIPNMPGGAGAGSLNKGSDGPVKG